MRLAVIKSCVRKIKCVHYIFYVCKLSRLAHSQTHCRIEILTMLCSQGRQLESKQTKSEEQLHESRVSTYIQMIFVRQQIFKAFPLRPAKTNFG